MKKITLIAALFIGAVAFSQGVVTVAGTSFEDEVITAGVNDAQYMDTGDANVAHDLINNALQTPVDQFGGPELEANARYEPYDTPSSGLTDGDFVGVTAFTGTVGAFTDGDQGYQFQDADGNMIVDFEVIDLTGHINNNVSLDYFIQETGYEGDGTANDSGNDRIRIYVKDLTNGTEIDILNTTGSDINDLGIEGVWINGSIALPSNISMQLVAELRSNSGSEALFLDNIVIEGEEDLGVDDNTIANFTMFPNPTSQDIISIVTNTNQTKNVVVFDILGKQVINTVVTNSQLNIATLKSGVYLVQITEDGITATKKLIVR